MEVVLAQGDFADLLGQKRGAGREVNAPQVNGEPTQPWGDKGSNYYSMGGRVEAGGPCPFKQPSLALAPCGEPPERLQRETQLLMRS